MNLVRRAGGGICVALFLDAAFAVHVRAADRPAPQAADSSAKELHAFRIVEQPPTVDGRLDDRVWSLAEPIEDFTQGEPDNMAPASQRTVVQIAYDDRFLYVAAHCYEADPSKIFAGLGRRDNFPPSDVFAVYLDPRHDHLTAYAFKVNASGVQGDLTFFDDTQSNNDYDAVWDARTGVTPDGWNVELAIPFSQMRFEAAPGARIVWGVQFRRDIQRRGEWDQWTATPRGEQGVVSRFGHLVFEALHPPRRIEMLPYAIGSLKRDPDEGQGLATGLGGDMRLGLGSSANLSATLNPDFGQVEADPSVLNLSVFETFFPEKRPFFLEDSRVFVLPYGQFPDFYSRRIGQTPNRFKLEDNETLVSKPDQTTLIGAVKVTGKASKWTYGGLGALTASEYGTVDETTTDAAGNETVIRKRRLFEPRTFYSVGRLQRDVRAGSNVGIITTGVMREGDRDAFTGGVDHNLRWSDNHFSLSGHWIGTHAPIDGVTYTDFGGATNFNYLSKHLYVFGHFDHFGEHFQNSDLGFLASRRDKNDANAGVSAVQPDVWRLFRYVEWFTGTGRQWNHDGEVFGRSVTSNVFLRTLNFWTLNGGYTHNFRRFDDLDTRGGPPIERAAGRVYFVNVASDTRKTWGGNLNIFRVRDRSGTWSESIASGIRVRPSDRLQASFDVKYDHGLDAAQWIKSEDVDGDDETDYVYGRLDRDVVSMTARGTYAFTRNVTLEAYLQPFVAAGDYTEIKKLARPRSFDFTPVTLDDDPDFNRRSVRGTMVMRWEYRPGSTVFVVWNLSTSETQNPRAFSSWHDLRTAFGAASTHVIAVKFNYWLAP